MGLGYGYLGYGLGLGYLVLRTTIITPIGGGSYWAGRAAARPLFGPCGPPIGVARPLLSTLFVNAIDYSVYSYIIKIKSSVELSASKCICRSFLDDVIYVP